MALEFRKLNHHEILRLASNPNPEESLRQMSVWELHLLIERIDEIAKNDPDAEILFGRIMRLKTYAVMTEESIRSAMGEGW